MRKFVVTVGFGIFIALGLNPSAKASEAPPTSSVDLPHAWPRPNAVKLIENERGTMWNVNFVAGIGSPWHRHMYEFVGLELTNSAIEVTDPQGVSRTFATARGSMWVLPKGLTHMERGLTTPGRNLLLVDLKEGASPAYPNNTKSPSGFLGSNAVLINDTPRFLQWDVSWVPGGVEKQTFHSRDIFIAFLDGGALRIIEDGGKPRSLEAKTGEGIFLKGGMTRKIEATSGRVRAMLVELK